MELLVALVAAVGSILTAYVTHVVVQTRRTVNGQLSALLERVTQLEVALAQSRVETIEAVRGGPAAVPPRTDFS